MAPKEIISQSKWNFSIELHPIYSYRTYTVNEYSKEGGSISSGKFLYDVFEDFYDSNEKPKFGYGATLGIGYKLTEKVRIKSGIGYKSIGEKIDGISKPRYQFGSTTVVHYSDENGTNLKNSYHYLTLPIEFNYKIGAWKKIIFMILAGSDIDYLLKSNINKYDPDVSFSLKNGGQVSTFAMTLFGGFSINFKIDNKYSFFIQPQFSRYITPNANYNIQLREDIYCKINQYNYYGQLKIGFQLK